MKYFQTLVAITIALTSQLALGWSTTTHVGMGVEDQSSTGFKQVAGSMMFLDLTHPLGDDWDLGVRTSGQGGRGGERQFYRLGAGPFVSWNFNESWSLQASISTFDETGVGADGDKVYRSKGVSGLFGWEKRHEIGPRVEVAWGGFVSRYQGNLTATPGSAPNSSLAGAVSNRGLSHGLEAALRVQLY